jgi:hypothetical protein
LFSLFRNSTDAVLRRLQAAMNAPNFKFYFLTLSISPFCFSFVSCSVHDEGIARAPGPSLIQQLDEILSAGAGLPPIAVQQPPPIVPFVYQLASLANYAKLWCEHLSIS